VRSAELARKFYSSSSNVTKKFQSPLPQFKLAAEFKLAAVFSQNFSRFKKAIFSEHAGRAALRAQISSALGGAAGTA